MLVGLVGWLLSRFGRHSRRLARVGVLVAGGVGRRRSACASAGRTRMLSTAAKLAQAEPHSMVVLGDNADIGPA